MGIKISEIEDMITNHIEEQPYAITCSECGADLNNSTKTDNDLDLHIEVDPCDCQKQDAE